MTRPKGSIGEVARAICSAAKQGPGTVRQLAERSQVGMRCAGYTAHRLIEAGHLAVVQDRRPMVLTLGTGVPPARRQSAEAKTIAQQQAMDDLHRLWWST